MGDPASYFDRDGRMRDWPSRKRRAMQLSVLARIAERFELGRQFSEKEVNAILKEAILITDYVLIRRELVQSGFLHRTLDGARYWRVPREEGSI